MSDTPTTVPHNIEAEQATLGAIFVDPDCLPEVLQIVKRPEQFYRASHRHIFAAIVALAERGVEPDWVQVAEEIRKRGFVEACGGEEMLLAYLSEISHAVPSAYGAAGYARIVADRFISREMAHLGTDLRNMALTQTRAPGELFDYVNTAVTELAMDRLGHQLQRMGAAAQRVVERHALQKYLLTHQANIVPGLSSGYKDLDYYTTGWKAGELIVIGARPGQGKTSLALNIAENVAANLAKEDYDQEEKEAPDPKKGGSVCLFSLEMTGDELAHKIVCTRARVDSQSVKLGKLSDAEEIRLEQEAEAVEQLPLLLDDSPVMTMRHIRAQAYNAVRRYRARLVIIDYLQHITQRSYKIDRFQHVTECARAAKSLARELSIPVIATAQLNRGLEQRGARLKKPVLADLRESGEIEQAADQVILLFPHGEADAREQDVELLIRKNRNGPTGDITMKFAKWRGRFELSEVKADDYQRDITEPKNAE